MKKELDAVLAFHKAFNCVINDKPTVVDKDTALLRIKLIDEEFKEVQEELLSENVDLAKLAKEVADLLYVTNGLIVTYGLQKHIEEVFKLTHENNMSKIWDDGLIHRNEFGKILKPDNFKKLDISHLFKEE